jgi:hypothetical protein
MAAHTLSVAKQSQALQSGLYYYSQSPHVPAVRGIAIAVDLAVLSSVTAWVARPAWGPRIRPALLALALLGAAGCWYEVVQAERFLHSASVRLPAMPVIPLANLGLAGSQAFLTYATVTLARRAGSRLSGAALLLSVGLGVAQWLAWEALSRLVDA